MTMAALLSTVGDVVTESISWLGEAVTFVVATPYLLLGLGLMVAGFVWGLLRRAIIKG